MIRLDVQQPVLCVKGFDRSSGEDLKVVYLLCHTIKVNVKITLHRSSRSEILLSNAAADRT